MAATVELQVRSDDTIGWLMPGWATDERPASLGEVARRVAAGLVHAGLPVPTDMHFGTDLVQVDVEHPEDLVGWAVWLGAAPAHATVYSAPEPGMLTRKVVYRALWRGFVIDVRHLTTLPMRPGGPT